MASSKFRLNKKLIFQMTLILMGFFIIFFTYFYTDKQKETVKKLVPTTKQSFVPASIKKSVIPF